MLWPKVLETEEDHGRALREIDQLVSLDPPQGSEAAQRLELLVLLTAHYEKQRFPAGAIDPVEAIRFRMEQQGLRRRDLIPYIGRRNRVSEVLNHKRRLTQGMIRRLHEGLGIPLEALIARDDA